MLVGVLNTYKATPSSKTNTKIVTLTASTTNHRLFCKNCFISTLVFADKHKATKSYTRGLCRI